MEGHWEGRRGTGKVEEVFERWRGYWTGDEYSKAGEGTKRGRSIGNVKNNWKGRGCSGKVEGALERLRG